MENLFHEYHFFHFGNNLKTRIGSVRYLHHLLFFIITPHIHQVIKYDFVMIGIIPQCGRCLDRIIQDKPVLPVFTGQIRIHFDDRRPKTDIIPYTISAISTPASATGAPRRPSPSSSSVAMCWASSTIGSTVATSSAGRASSSKRCSATTSPMGRRGAWASVPSCPGRAAEGGMPGASDRKSVV